MKSLNSLKTTISTKNIISNSAAVKGGANNNSNYADYTIGEPWDNRKRPGTK